MAEMDARERGYETTTVKGIPQMTNTQTLMPRTQQSFEVTAAPQQGMNARMRSLTLAQRRAVMFAQQQVLRARAAKKAKDERREALSKMWMNEDDSVAQERIQTDRTVVAKRHRATLRESLGSVLRDLRTDDHKTLREVSEKAGVSLG